MTCFSVPRCFHWLSCAASGFVAYGLSFPQQGWVWALEGSVALDLVESCPAMTQHPRGRLQRLCLGETSPFPRTKPAVHRGLSRHTPAHLCIQGWWWADDAFPSLSSLGVRPNLLRSFVISFTSEDLCWGSGPFLLDHEPAVQHSWRMTAVMRQLITKLT